MKMKKLLMLVAIIAIACSCEKEQMLPEPDKETTFQVQELETRSTEAILSFASLEEMEMQIAKLATMSEKEQNTWYAERNFESQYDALYRAAAEIDEATTLEEAEAIKAKFSPYFLYNENPADEELFNPYLPNEKPDYAYVCNINGEVIIAGEIVNFNTITNVRDTHEYQLSHNAITRASAPNITEQNILKRTVGKRKFWAEGRYIAEFRAVLIEFTAHKKGIFGWNKYTTAYHIRIAESYRNASTYGWTQYGGFVTEYFKGVDQKIYTAAEGCWTTNYKSHSTVDVGKIKPNAAAGITLSIYSRGTGIEGEGPLRIGYVAK